MLNPRLYRTGMVLVLLALIVVAFSLQPQARPLNSTLVPDAFNAGDAMTGLNALAGQAPDPRAQAPDAGGTADAQLSERIARLMTQASFSVATQSYPAPTSHGERTVTAVTATKPGQVAGTLVVLAPRDGPGNARQVLSGTAVMLELERVLGGETPQHTVIFASVSGSAGGGGAAALLARLPQPLSAVLVLGDLLAAHPRQPLLLPFSSSTQLAPMQLRATLSSALATQAQLPTHGVGALGQLARLALPLADGLEAPINAGGTPGLSVSLSGLQPAGAELGDGGQSRLGQTGRALLQSFQALDAAPAVARPSAYLLIKNKVIPLWALRLLVLACLLPVLALAVDGLARAGRRGFPSPRWLLGTVLGAAAPAAALLVLFFAHLTGALPRTPGGLLGPGRLLPASLTEVLVALAALLVAGGVGVTVRALNRHALPVSEHGWRNPGAASAVLVLLCGLSLAVWVQNPIAALLLVPAVHLWAWALDPDLPLPRALRGALYLVGLLPPVLALAAVASQDGLGPVEFAHSLILALAAGAIPLGLLIPWCLIAGCAAAAAAVVFSAGAVQIPRSGRRSVRGPAGYAGPGSLGGTESALRR